MPEYVEEIESLELSARQCDGEEEESVGRGKSGDEEERGCGSCKREAGTEQAGERAGRQGEGVEGEVRVQESLQEGKGWMDYPEKDLKGQLK